MRVCNGVSAIVSFAGSVRISVHFAYELRDASGGWFRSYGNENWEFEAGGPTQRRFASINDLPITEADRKFHWPFGHGPTIIGARAILPSCRPVLRRRFRPEVRAAYGILCPNDGPMLCEQCIPARRSTPSGTTSGMPSAEMPACASTICCYLQTSRFGSTVPASIVRCARGRSPAITHRPGSP